MPASPRQHIFVSRLEIGNVLLELDRWNDGRREGVEGVEGKANCRRAPKGYFQWRDHSTEQDVAGPFLSL